jgi:hypothetical protein
MIALPPWAFTVLLLGLAVGAAWILRVWLARQPGHARLALLATAVGLAMAITLSPPFDTSQQACDPLAGLLVHATADAQEDGYLLPASSGYRYFAQAVYDLVQGRIRFFEIEQSNGQFARYRLASTHSPACIDRDLHDAELSGLPLPMASCVAVSQHPDSVARYLLEGYQEKRQRPPRFVGLRDRSDGRMLAEYRQPRGGWNLWGWQEHADCRAQRQQAGHPLWNLPAFALRDSQGAVFDRRAYQQARDELGSVGVDNEPLPPPAWVLRQLAQTGQLAPEACHLPGWSGPTEVYALSLDQGPLAVPARLDARSNSAGVVLVDVHAPDKAVVIVARARDPTIWHFHESSRSSIVAVLVLAEQGQAVVGLTRHTRVLMSTRLHNPQTNCSAVELGEIVARLTEQHGIAQQHAPPALASEKPVRYALGEPMPIGGELFHHDRRLSEFELRGD